MIEGRINLYSDTQTRPTPEMKAVMLDAPMGDEQHMLDPSVNALCDYVANLLGMEAAVFMPSGTMCNEIAILVHCRPGMRHMPTRRPISSVLKGGTGRSGRG